MSENKHTSEDLKIMQAWPLGKKILVTQAKIMEWYYRHDGMVSISTSGGKDSLVLLDIARRCFPDIDAVFVDTGLEFPEVREVARSTPNVTVLKPAMRFDEVVKVCGSGRVSAAKCVQSRRGRRQNPTSRTSAFPAAWSRAKPGNDEFYF